MGSRPRRAGQAPSPEGTRESCRAQGSGLSDATIEGMFARCPPGAPGIKSNVPTIHPNALDLLSKQLLVLISVCLLMLKWKLVFTPMLQKSNQ